MAGAAAVRHSGSLSKRYWSRVSRSMGIAGLVLTIYGFFAPYPLVPVMILLAASPWIALAISRASQGKLATLDEPKKGFGLSILVIGPPLALTINDLTLFPVLSGWRLLAFGAPLGLAIGLVFRQLAVAVPKVSKEPKWLLVITGWIGAIAYGWALLAAANGLLPQSSAVTYKVPVLGKFQSGSVRHTTYSLTVPPLGPISKTEDWDVPGYIYRRESLGGPVCILIHPGALNAPWYEASLCS